MTAAAQPAAAASGQALRVIEGERKAEQYLARLRAQQASAMRDATAVEAEGPSVDDGGEELVVALDALGSIGLTKLQAWAEECGLDPAKVRDTFWGMQGICQHELRRLRAGIKVREAIGRAKGAAVVPARAEPRA